ncbi:vacuolar (H+)-ATPase G subunit domain-containing protein, putative [Eimeria acervulina]|uniref:Vacuolar (H+)-ATPase G subunit domain-containing protein, putative n=1 Tax=Eimeria acervulina TaxID=5801 RepID=U6GXV1_EIMAC|nr:vacuolar (H+)-ATPase G subunit domain-containing protein, putative [Eimeria acervulina]CDI83379.1 vacuolar (H+)-ATPase G subunit domain-containing protein, putative [Eimeria acervulina]
MRSDSSKTSSRDQGGHQTAQNGEGRLGKASSGGKQSNEGAVSTETDHAKRGFHGLRQRFHTTHHTSSGQGTAGQEGTADHSLHLPLHLRHLHFPHILHHPAQHANSSSAESETEVMQLLQKATNQAKRIVERARGEHELLMQRAREEAEAEIQALRCELEAEALKDEQEGNGGEDAIREATLEEDNRMRQILERASERMEASVSLCVGHVLNVDTSLAADRRGALQNLRKNPPNFLRKSQAKSFPSERRMLAERRAKGKRATHVSDFSWDVDALEYPAVDNSSPEQEKLVVVKSGQHHKDRESFSSQVRIEFAHRCSGGRHMRRRCIRSPLLVSNQTTLKVQGGKLSEIL